MDVTPDYRAEQQQCRDFLEKFALVDEDDDEPVYKYMNMLQEVANRGRSLIEIDLNDVASTGEDGRDLVERVVRNAKRYISLFSRAIDDLMPQPTVPLGDSGSVVDVLVAHRIQQQGGDDVRPFDIFPPDLLRRYMVTFVAPAELKPEALRRIKAKHIGGLVVIKGIVTRVTEVRPMMVVATYSCDTCGFENYQEVTARQFTPLVECQSARCKAGGTPGKLFLQTRGSKFVPFQELRIQEMSDQVPAGHIPRSMTVHAHGDLARQANPGDVVVLTGIFLPTPYTGFRALRAGLVADTYLETMRIERVKKNFDEFQVTPEMLEQIEALKNDSQVYDKLSKSIAPEIFGMTDVKRALLLQLVGGVTRKMSDGMLIRGDINICLVGDPGVAKSQLLKYISTVAPRGVYTTGKGSSGVGLTAAVMRDPLTNEMILEGGALVLADNGVCCIDEFDKMEDSDRTAIHEVMEQQTVSISKAGINTTLNARAAILAAANPAYGRYNIRRTMLQNINLPAALLSRFDLIFLLLDVANQDGDRELANHVTFVHTHQRHPPTLGFEPVSSDVLRAYVAQARQLHPFVPTNRNVVDRIIRTYVVERDGQTNRRQRTDTGRPTEAAEDMTYTTPRSLLGILRLSQALARLRFSSEIAEGDVVEAIRLIHSSKESLLAHLGASERRGVDPITAIYDIIVGSTQTEEGSDDVYALYDDVLNRAIARGYTQAQVQQCIEQYQDELGVWMLSADRTRITFISS